MQRNVRHHLPIRNPVLSVGTAALALEQAVLAPLIEQDRHYAQSLRALGRSRQVDPVVRRNVLAYQHGEAVRRATALAR
jgi:hypothetical protein